MMKNNTNEKRGLLRIRNNKGSVLLTTFLLVTILLILGAAFTIVSTNEAKVSESQRKVEQAFNFAEAGLERMMYYLKKDFEDDENWSDGEINGWTYDVGDADADGYFPYPDPDDANIGTYPSPVINYGGVDQGQYQIELKSGSGMEDIWIRVKGTVLENGGTSEGMSQTILVYVKIVSLSPWDNAIFGGSGSSGGWVNGNVNVSGSVHVLGDGLDPGDNAINLGGTAELVRNNYSILDPALEALVPALPTTTVNGEVVETLNSELRVRNGNVGLSGNSSVGEPNADGNGEKETVDGVYINDEYTGNKGAANVYSDNGTSTAYDLGDSVEFPSLLDPYPANPAQNYYEYFAANGLVLTNELAAVTGASSFTYGDCSSNCITMDGAGNMEVQGMIYIDGTNNLSLSGATDITYTGTGTILLEGGDALLDVNLYVSNTSGKGSYPENILGVMTPNDIEVGAGSQKDVMGIFYAEGEIETNMQTNLVGSIVANQFNITNQVPSIFQVPEVSNNLPPGMIAGEPIFLMKVVSWEKTANPD